jgi:hypothetical protein
MALLSGISILEFDSASHQDQAVRKRKFEPDLECKAVPTVPQLASSARRGRAAPENAVFPIDSADTSPLPNHQSQTSAPLRASTYPLGDGSSAILRSVPANSRRVRWLSARSNQ